jgi:hypothetical protein
MIGDGGVSVTLTEATGTGFTTSVAVPLMLGFSVLVAVIVTVCGTAPGATVVIAPVPASTEATAGSLEVHVTPRPGSSELSAARLIAVA